MSDKVDERVFFTVRMKFVLHEYVLYEYRRYNCHDISYSWPYVYMHTFMFTATRICLVNKIILNTL